jgi:ribosomal protein S3
MPPGSVPLNTLDAHIDHASIMQKTRNGTRGSKVWPSHQPVEPPGVLINTQSCPRTRLVHLPFPEPLPRSDVPVGESSSGI